PPTAVVADPFDGHTYVLTGSTGAVHIIDGNLTKVSSKKISDELVDLRIMPDGKRLIAVAARSRELIEVDAVSLKTVRRHKLGAQPIGFDVASTQYAAVSTGQHGTVELFNLATGQQSRTRLTGAVGTVRFRSDGAA